MRAILLFSYAFLALNLSAQVVDLGTLSRQVAHQVIPIAIVSSDPALQVLAEKAFLAHGAFSVVPGDKAAFLARFKKTNDGRAVNLMIESGRPRQIQYQHDFMGNSWVEATLRACDRVVEKTSGLKGFFAGRLACVVKKSKGFKQICVSDIFFQEVMQITHDRADSITPHWAPGGHKLTYTGYFQSGSPDVFTISIPSGRRQAIASYKGTNTGGAFSPNGGKVALALSSSGNPEIYVANVDGQHPKRLTKSKSLEASPTWTRDGQSLVFTSDESGGPQLFRMPAQGGVHKRIPTNISGYCAEPSCNQVNDQIAFTAAMRGGFQLALYEPEKGKSRFLTQGNVDSLEPCWASDGRHVFFTRRTKDSEQISLLDTVSGKHTVLHSVRLGRASQAAFVYPSS